ncbi:holliday junction DNA helicase RuvA [Flexibacter flexilis DSM 6793]|uniref:Holliday junction branch migration complex subunit RuvA n=1 Tax=Flexibacter flexilis DSM 6793 TaxID=927664 RepID=A0A1I1FIQ0_9BACT|nr:Holliday junction branch migration protein RuvA [Flexibacter flexilis]SFB96993.1 holliday junction DNA helicase RuvA [Flexibacter flexilis DSM 6793]
MIAYIDGKLVHKDPAFVIIDVHGVGYQLKISLNTYAALKDSSERCRLHTYLHIKEDAHTLYGFFDTDEKKLFLHLISVSGIGPGTALLALSSMPAVELQQAIATENLRVVQSIKGIGAKTAQRMILELRDKVRKEAISQFPDMPDLVSVSAHNTSRSEALSALVALGIAKPAAEKTLDTIIKRDGADLSVEDLIKKALKQ